MPNIVFIATSLDGYITDRDGGLDWLNSIPNPDGDDGGFEALMSRVDAVVMGRNTFEAVAGFGIGWPYSKPGLVLSTFLQSVPEGFESHVQVTQGHPEEVIAFARARGFGTLYIDGGRTIQAFLDADLIDEMIVTEVPVILGGGSRLFGETAAPLMFELTGVETLRGQLLQKSYRRLKEVPQGT